jgi:hypothetical protein
MALVRYNPLNNPTLNRGNPPPQWPNRQTALNLLLVVGNIAFEILSFSLPVTLIYNVPLRLVSISTDIKNEKYHIVFVKIAAFIALFFPYGRFAAVVSDLFAEYFNFCENQPRPQQQLPALQSRIDPRVPRNALTILDIPLDQAYNYGLIREKYDSAIALLENRISRATPMLATYWQGMIDDCRIAYRTLETLRGVEWLPQS